jgi:hypothetical protein
MWHGWKAHKRCEHCGNRHQFPVLFCEQCDQLIGTPPRNSSDGRKREKKRPFPGGVFTYCNDSQGDGTCGDD